MSEIYDNWDRLVGRVIRHVKDRELCYQSNLRFELIFAAPPWPPQFDGGLCFVAGNCILPSCGDVGETFSSSILALIIFRRLFVFGLHLIFLQKFVYRVDLDGVETMKGAFKAGDLFRLIGICFSPNVRVDLLRKPQVILKLIASITGNRLRLFYINNISTGHILLYLFYTFFFVFQ